ncbi:MAG: 30S ribosome-binding factor RbfA [Vicinamibacterales bacterium]|nr:30S ribosome-binding factor RbfA [Vicinamibacterales bacterium]
MASFRPERVGDQIREQLSEMLVRGEVHDPGIGFITLTRVKVTGDLQIARVYYTQIGDAAARKATAKALERATPYLRRRVGGELRLRRVPELEFRFDEAIENQARLEEVIREIHEHPPEALHPELAPLPGENPAPGEPEKDGK